MNAVDARGRTALHFAATARNLRSLKVLLQHGGDATLRDSEYRDTFMSAFVFRDVKFSRDVIELGHTTLEQRVELYELLGTYLMPWSHAYDETRSQAFTVWSKVPRFYYDN